MKRNNKLLMLTFFLVLAIPLVFISGDAGAYVSDGTCLMCHNPYGHDKTSYLMTGHKNMLRVVDGTMTNAHGEAYTLDPTTLMIYGGWYRNTVQARIGQTTRAMDVPREIKPTTSYTCGECHTTGYDAAGGGPEPSTSVPTYTGNTNGATWELFGVQCERCHGEATQDNNAAADSVPGLDATYLKYRIKSFTGATDTDGDGDFCDYGGSSGTTSYYMYSNDYKSTADMATATFYDSTGAIFDPATITDPCTPHATPQGVHHGGTYNSNTSSPVTVPEMEHSTHLCAECHIQHTTADQEMYEVGVGSHGSYKKDFDGHYRTNQFLNSPHARFEGTHGEITDHTKYDSHFSDYATHENRGCAGCHDVHYGSADPANVNLSHVDNKCGVNCHAYKKVEDIRHPSGPGTPILDTSTDAGKMSVCVTCHMGPGTNHLFRINIDPAYTPFPTEAEYNAGQKLAYTYDEEGYPAVGMDVDLACGQCHGGSGSAKEGVPYMNREYLAAWAVNIHQTPDARFNWYNGGCDETGYKINFDATMNAGATDSVTKFAWDFGDGVNDATRTSCNSKKTICTYAYENPGSYAVTLTINYGHSRTMIVTVKGNNAVPTSGMTVSTDVAVTLDATGMSAKVTDASSANSCGSTTSGTATVLWGDGTTTVANINEGDVVGTHPYGVAGTYTIRYSFKDSNGNKSMADPVTVTLPDVATATCNVTGNVSGAEINLNTLLTLKKGSTVVKQASTDENGDYAFKNVQAGAEYTIIPSRNGYSFDPVSETFTLECGVNNTGHDFTATSEW